MLHDDLKAVYKLLRAKSRWTKGTFARNRSGGHVGSDSPEAVCWCLSGAINKIGSDAVRRAIDLRLPDQTIAEFNDSHTHKQVLKLIKDTINYEFTPSH